MAPASRRRATVTETIPGAEAPSGESALALRIVESPDGRKVDTLVRVDGIVRLGRGVAEGGGVGLDDERVSTTHLAVYREDDGTLAWRDTQSKNGTFVNGVRGVAGHLFENDVVRVGSTFMVVTRDGDAHASARRALEPHVTALGLIGRAPPYLAALEMSRLAAVASMPVLVLGPSGSGKEGVARLVHHASGRTGAFVAVNCATLVGEMANATLFGHTKGAFTGAVSERPGLFRSAQGGTLFLDEVGELGLDIQARLLRALEQREVVPVGSDAARSIDVRVVCATNADLHARAALGEFRGDLLARLSGIPVQLPPLSERREDILALARYFAVQAIGARGADEGPLFAADAIERLLTHGWPFNVRELRQLVMRLCLLAPLPFSVGALGLALAERGPRDDARAPGTGDTKPRGLRQRPTKEELERALDASEHNVSAVARAFGRDRRQVYRWLEQYGIPTSDPEPSSRPDRPRH